MYPTRGEVLIIRAPWIDHGLSYSYKDNHLSYIIPRQSGDIILGGTFQVGDWYVASPYIPFLMDKLLLCRHPNSRPETVKLIKERGIEAYPELLPPNKRELRNIEDLDVVEECVGLRPTRNGGVRLETTSLSKLRERWGIPMTDCAQDVGLKNFPIVHNYGSVQSFFKCIPYIRTQTRRCWIPVVVGVRQVCRQHTEVCG